MMTDSRLDIPAFVLGNGPSLPGLGALAPLQQRFTVGVNRILRSGFTPTVILWVDRNVYDEDGPQIDTSGSLLVCDRAIAQRRHHIGLQTWVGEAALRRQPGPSALCCDGNTGCCAARWALALGCSPVYLLGMDAEYLGGVSDFYGDNDAHRRIPGDNSTLAVMGRELGRLLSDYPNRVYPIPSEKALAEFVDQTQDVDQDEIKGRIRGLLAADVI